MAQIEYSDMDAEEILQKHLDIIKRQDAVLQQIEDILRQMEQLAILSASDSGDWLVDRKQLQDKLECLLSELNCRQTPLT